MAFYITTAEAKMFPVKMTFSDNVRLGTIMKNYNKDYAEIVNKRGLTEIKFGVDENGSLEVELIAPDCITNEETNKRIDSSSVLNDNMNKRLNLLSSTSKFCEDDLRPVTPKGKPITPDIIYNLSNPTTSESSTSSSDSTSNSSSETSSTNSDIQSESELDVDGLEKVTGAELANFVDSNKRVMFKRITASDIENVNEKFFENSDREIRIKVSKMCHAQRFWLAKKFHVMVDELKLNLSHNKISKIFGVSRATMIKHIAKYGKKSYNDFGFLSPSEFRPGTQWSMIKRLASNYDEIAPKNKKGKHEYK